MVGRRISCTVELAITAGLTGALEPQVKTRSAAVVVSKLLWLRHQSLLFSGRRPTGRCAVGPSDRTGRGTKGNDTRGREASLSLLPSQSRISPPPLTSRRGPGEHEWNRAAATTSGGGRVSGEEKRRSVASHHRSRRVRGITRVSSAAVAAANATLACQCVTGGGGGGRDENKRWMRACKL